jgi:hypothetical protein
MGGTLSRTVSNRCIKIYRYIACMEFWSGGFDEVE